MNYVKVVRLWKGISPELYNVSVKRVVLLQTLSLSLALSLCRQLQGT